MTTTQQAGSPPPGGSPTFSLRKSSPRRGERAVETLLLLAALVSVVTTIGIVFSLFDGTRQFLQDVPIGDFLFGTVWTPLFAGGEYGVLPIVSATFAATAVALILAIPLGLGSAIYLSEFASRRARSFWKPILEILAGIPTVVLGFFALTFVTPNVLQVIFDDVGVFNVLAGGLIIGLLLIPIIASLSDDALSAVPQSMRDGALALGATRAGVARKVVLPAALSGVVASFVLAGSRGIGETLVAAIAMGSLAQFASDLLEPAQTMTGFIAQAASGDQPTGSVSYNSLFAVGMLLFLVTLVLNVVSIALVRRYREVYE